MKYKTVPLMSSVCLEDVNPIFSESVIRVRVDDEGGGAFVVLESGDVKISMDLEQLEAVLKVARRLIAANEPEAK